MIGPDVFSRCKHNNFHKWNELSKYEPDIYVLDIGCGGKTLHHTNEQGGEHKHGRQVHCQGCLEVEGLVVRGGTFKLD